MDQNRITLKNLFTILIITLITTLLAFALEEFGFRRENILLIYMVAVMTTIIETKKFLLGFLSSILFGFIFNFLFTEPKYTFLIDDFNYYISMIIFILVSIIISTLASKLQKQIEETKKNQQKIEILYQMSKKLLTIHSVERIAVYELEYLEKLLNRDVYVSIYYKTFEKQYYHHLFFESQNYENEIDWCMKTSIVCGYKENHFSNLPFKIFPLKASKGNIGILIVDCIDGDLTNEEKQFVVAMISHMTIALEREILSMDEEKIRVEMEKEKFKSSLLRSISHDLRTPLTSLLTGSSILLDNYQSIDEETKISIIQDLNHETSYLSSFVENLLNLTRIDSNKLIINKKREVIEDIVSEVIHRVSKRIGQHKLQVDAPKEMLFIYADSQLILQVLVNLVDNAIKHTKHDSKIILKYYQDNFFTWFEVIDNGGGINTEKLQTIFDDFTSLSSNNADKNRGIGLGLGICRGIIEAHQGSINAYNNDFGGMTFSFKIPLGKEDEKNDR